MEVITWIAYILIGVPLGAVAAGIAICVLGVWCWFLGLIWWNILYVSTFSWNTKLIPPPPRSHGESF